MLRTAKVFFHRGRPPEGLVETVGFSFPSGHAVAGAATAVALVLALLPAGRKRRRWESARSAFAFVMASSRVYLQAHWFSDVVAGVLLGAGVALGSAASRHRGPRPRHATTGVTAAEQVAGDPEAEPAVRRDGSRSVVLTVRPRRSASTGATRAFARQIE